MCLIVFLILVFLLIIYVVFLFSFNIIGFLFVLVLSVQFIFGDLVKLSSFRCLFVVNKFVLLWLYGKMENVFFGRLVLVSILLMISVLIGVCEVGLSIKVQLVVIVGVILWVVKLSGKLNGDINEYGLIGIFFVIF